MGFLLPFAPVLLAGARRWQDYDDNDPARVDRLNEIVAEAIAGRPRFQVVDVAGWLRSAPGGEFDRTIRDDGIHCTFEGSDAVAAWLVPQVLDAVAAHGARLEVPVSTPDAGQ